MKNILLLFLLFILIQCNFTDTKQNANTFEKCTHIGDKVFSTGFKYFTYIDKTYLLGQEEFVVYCDFVTRKIMKIHSLSSNTEYTIPLNAVTDKNESILTFDIISLDTILIMAKYTNHLYFLNRKGEIFKMIDLNPYLLQFYDTDYTFEASGVNNPFMYNDTSLIVKITAYKKHKIFSFVDYYGEVYNDSIPYFFKIDNIFEDSITFKFGLYKFYQNFSTENVFTGSIRAYSFINKQVVIKDLYSDTLYMINPNTLYIEKRVRLKSNLIDQDLLVSPVSLAEMDNGYDHNEHKTYFPRLLSPICYNKKSKNYFLSIIQNKVPRCVIMVLDSNFLTKDEIILDTSKYRSLHCLTNDDLLIINNNKQFKNDENFYKINTFSLFKYNEK